jgi:hypothetical protein
LAPLPRDLNCSRVQGAGEAKENRQVVQRLPLQQRHVLLRDASALVARLRQQHPRAFDAILWAANGQRWRRGRL